MTTNTSNDVPDYQSLYEEFHSRPFPVITVPVSVSHLAVLYKKDTRQSTFNHIVDLSKRYQVAPPAPDSNYYYQDFGDFLFRWEAHTEFFSFTIITASMGDEPFSQPAMSLLPSDWVQQIAGDRVAALHVEIRCPPEQPISCAERLKYFEEQRVISAFIGVKQSELWSAFKLHSDGYNRALIFDNGHSKRQLGVLLRSVLEMETYRNIALLSLPVIQPIIRKVREMEITLASIISRIVEIETLEDERTLLAQLSKLSAQIERLISNTVYRVSASNAYFELTYARLDELKEPVETELISIKSFIERRLRPAQQTCNSVYSRMLDLSHRIERASQLLRTRINVALESQNQQLLLAMEKRSKVSLALQKTVEGLSVAVITYYVISLLQLSATSGFEMLGIDPNLAIGVSVPIVLLTVWLIMRKVRRKVEKALEE